MTWEERLSTLARERGPALLAYGYLLTGERHEAQDLVQEALVRTFSRRASGDVEALEAYVRRTMLTTYLNSRRSAGRWNGLVHLLADHRRPAAPEATATDRTDVSAALAILPPRERACIVLRHYEDLTVPDIADRLGLSIGAVKRYLSDAHRRLGPLVTDTDRNSTDVTILEGGAR